MQIEEKFNKRGADLILVAPPTVHSGPPYPLGVELTYYEPGAIEARRRLVIHMSPDEALAHAADLIQAAREAIACAKDS